MKTPFSFYITDSDGNITTTDNLEEYTKWFSVGSNRRVGSDYIGDAHVSTVFLAGLANEHFYPTWETIVFGVEKGSDPIWRWASRKEAEEGHQRVVKVFQYLEKRKSRKYN